MKLKVYNVYVAAILIAIFYTRPILAQNQMSTVQQNQSVNYQATNLPSKQYDSETINRNISEKVKVTSKSYTVDGNDKLAINNQYGKVDIHTWEKNEIKVDVEVKAFESSDEKAEALLNSVSINESRQGNVIRYKTEIERKSVSWTSRFKNGKEERRGVQINYVVYMPASNPLDLLNRYGSIELQDFTGPVFIDNAYGSLAAGKLSNPANKVEVGYGSASIGGLYAGNLEVAYGSLDLTVADKVNLNVRYSSAKIQKAINGGNFDIRYAGGFKIVQVDKSVKNLNINASYSDLTLGMDAASNFDFEVIVNYASFHYNDKVTITSKTPSDNERGFNPQKVYKGYFGKSSDAMITVKSNYGSVKFQ